MAANPPMNPEQLQVYLQDQQAQLAQATAQLVVLRDEQDVWTAKALAQEQAANVARQQVQAARDAAVAVQATQKKHDDDLGKGNLSLPRGYRPEGPPKYHGREGEDLEAWIFQLKESDKLFPIGDEMQRVRYVALSLRDTAARWYSAVQMKVPPEIKDWESFITKLRAQFMQMDQKFIARNQMHALQQQGSVREYSVKFRNLHLLIPEMSEEDAIDRYIRGLKDFAWRVWRKKYTDLDKAMIYAEELDLEVRQKHLLSTGSTNSNGKLTRGTQEDVRVAPRRVPWQPRTEAKSAFTRGGPTPMELGVLRMDESERSRHMQQSLCFNCHKPGHIANVCPAKKGLLSGNGDRRR
jgi:hypothetical protein